MPVGRPPPRRVDRSRSSSTTASSALDLVDLEHPRQAARQPRRRDRPPRVAGREARLRARSGGTRGSRPAAARPTSGAWPSVERRRGRRAAPCGPGDRQSSPRAVEPGEVGGDGRLVRAPGVGRRVARLERADEPAERVVAGHAVRLVPSGEITRGPGRRGSRGGRAGVPVPARDRDAPGAPRPSTRRPAAARATAAAAAAAARRPLERRRDRAGRPAAAGPTRSPSGQRRPSRRRSGTGRPRRVARPRPCRRRGRRGSRPSARRCVVKSHFG